MKLWPVAALALAVAALQGPSVLAQDAAPAADYALIQQAIEAGRLVQARAMLANQLPAEGERPGTEFDLLGAELALAERRDDQALAAFSDLKRRGVAGCRVDGGLGIALVRHQRAGEALAPLRAATQACPERWRFWNTLGIALDLSGDWQGSAHAYETAFGLSGHDASVMNNYGFSLLLQRRYVEAARLLAAAAGVDSAHQRYANNADIARSMAGEPLRAGDADRANAGHWARRLNNAGYASLLAGRADEAKAYFSRSLFAGDSYFQAAGANLAAMAGGE